MIHTMITIRRGQDSVAKVISDGHPTLMHAVTHECGVLA